MRVSSRLHSPKKLYPFSCQSVLYPCDATVHGKVKNYAGYDALYFKTQYLEKHKFIPRQCFQCKKTFVVTKGKVRQDDSSHYKVGGCCLVHACPNAMSKDQPKVAGATTPFAVSVG